MPKLIRIFFTGMLISFLGSLPLGTLNVAAMQISVTEGVRQALLFSTGCLAAEVIYVRISLVAIDWIRKQERLFRVLEWATLAIVLALAISSIYAAVHPKAGGSILQNSTLPKFVLGFTMGAVNPMQIPFWFGWSTVLFTKKVLLPYAAHYNSYIAGIGIGTFFGNCVFIFGGKFIVDSLNAKQSLLHWIIGGIFGITAIIQFWRMMRKRMSFQDTLEHPEKITHGFEKNFHE
jgi:threonine/homoserine/homoserine lactone efflux protein